MKRSVYQSDKKEGMITKEMLCSLYGITPDEVNCRNCRFLNLHTIDLDRKEGHCSYWKTIIRWHSFCTHFMNRGGKKA